jgi:hypothetical protein
VVALVAAGVVTLGLPRPEPAAEAAVPRDDPEPVAR